MQEGKNNFRCYKIYGKEIGGIKMNEYKRQELLDLIEELYDDERINLTAYNKLKWAIEEDE